MKLFNVPNGLNGQFCSTPAKLGIRKILIPYTEILAH